MTIGEKIKALRKSAHLTQTELAEKVGATKHYIAALETNQYTKPSMDFILRISKACGYAVEVNFVPIGSECKELTLK